jgi:hypothetical protein
MDDFEQTIFRSKTELPYPLNYMAYENPFIAYMLIKVSDRMVRNGNLKVIAQNEESYEQKGHGYADCTKENPVCESCPYEVVDECPNARAARGEI